MQYEMLATSRHMAHDHGTAGHATPNPAPHAGHAAMEHSHAGMDHSAHAGHMGMDHDMSDPGMAAAMERDMRNKFFIALLLTIPTVLYSSLGMRLLGAPLPTFGLSANLIMLVFSTPVVLYCGWIFIAGAYHSLRHGMLNMSVLIATGVLAAYVFSVLITFLVGDMVLLRPGDKVPVDGEVIVGETSIDEALVTGESVPVTKRPGDGVIAGSINRSGSVRFRATKVGADTTLAQIVSLCKRRRTRKRPDSASRIAPRSIS